MQPIYTEIRHRNNSFRTYHKVCKMTNLPTVESSLSPRIHTRAEITSQNRSTSDLPRSSLFELIIPQSMFLILRPEQQDAFFPVQPRLPFLGSFKDALSFSSAFPAFSHLFPTTPLHWGNLDSSSNLNKFLSRIFERFLGICCLIHPHGFWQVISILFLDKLHNYFIYFLK